MDDSGSESDWLRSDALAQFHLCNRYMMSQKRQFLERRIAACEPLDQVQQLS